MSATEIKIDEANEQKFGGLCPFRTMQTEVDTKLLACVGKRCGLWSRVDAAAGFGVSEGCAFRLIAEREDSEYSY